jgi:RNA polymerase sigma-70 factor, ECF subfamily
MGNQVSMIPAHVPRPEQISSSHPSAQAAAVSVPSAGEGRRGTQEAIWRACLHRIADGEQAALGQLYDESASLVYSMVLRVVANTADAEEVTMDVYSQVWKNAAGYDLARGSVTAWLITLARSRAIDRVRSRTSRAAKETAMPETYDAPAQAPSPEQETETHQRRRRVLAALATLPADQRQVVELAFYSGLTHSELAERLGQPLGTVKTRIRMGMTRLREQLAGEAL